MTSEQKTRCPHCQTAFKVTADQLQAASGMVRCGKCFKVFNGRDNLLMDEPAPPATATLTAGKAAAEDDDDFLIDDSFDVSRLENSPPSEHTIVTSMGNTASQSTLGSLAGAGDVKFKFIPSGSDQQITPPADSVMSEEIIFVPGRPMSSLTEELEELNMNRDAMSRWRPEIPSITADTGASGSTSRASRSNWLWFTGCILASILLVLQLIQVNSLSINRNSPLWPISSRVCALVGCPLPPAVDLDRILSTDLVIRSHPDVAGALLVNAVIVNTADFVQPFPKLTLVFENLQGNTIAQRTFLPEEYLTGDLAGLNLMPTRQPVELELEIVDPGKEAVSYRLFIAK